MFRLRSAADDSRTAPRRAQVVLRWIVQRGHLLATSSDKATWDAEDLDLFSWSLSSEEMDELDRAQTPVETGTPPQPKDDAQDCLVP